MKKTAALIIYTLLIAILIIGCSKKEEDIPASDVIKEDEEHDLSEDVTTEETEVVEVREGKPSPISGIYGPEDKINRRPVAVMFDNHPRARWQAGLSQAEIVYEFLVEAPYTRYMGLYILNDPELIGPVRSARPYFVTTLLEYDPIYVRVGGSEEAKAEVKRLQVADVDGLYSGAFFRYYETGKKAPNNLYTTMEKVRQEQKNKGFKEEATFDQFIFSEKDIDIVGDEADSVLIKYNNENITEYVYNNSKKIYERYKDGKLHIDEADDVTITAKNIIIQEANTKVIDNVGRLAIEVIGDGNGIYITNGKSQNITWEKESINSKTRYYNEEGEEITLNTGITWIQVISTNTSITIE